MNIIQNNACRNSSVKIHPEVPLNTVKFSNFIFYAIKKTFFRPLA